MTDKGIRVVIFDGDEDIESWVVDDWDLDNTATIDLFVSTLKAVIRFLRACKNDQD
ncbi:unnamed protein product [marine sediment metagenome]|uniref:Uncharacterized protein n=1 Tax=marine sediment metagenome TaxID=412755 RepID=X1ILT3_9ZZZZ